ncbi:hypothetical protein [Pontibacillus sp. HMF3514]|uniref:hypothetical protein n=1 Tax=Pontibacillus sp. HMF3514 TaxID=2692425 RepID=UPI00351B0276
MLYLTEYGKELGEKVMPVAEEFNDVVTKGISNEEIQELERLFSKIDQNVQEQ